MFNRASKMKRQFSGFVIWIKKESWSCAYAGVIHKFRTVNGGGDGEETFDFLNNFHINLH